MKIRDQARGIVINGRGEMLFVRYEDERPSDPNEPERLAFWVPPGGAVEQGESYEESAVREVFEETGLRVEGPGKLVHTLEKPLLYRDELCMMHAQYYLMFHLHEPCDVSNCDPDEGIKDVRWWSLEDCERSDEVFVPNGILDIFRKALGSYAESRAKLGEPND